MLSKLAQDDGSSDRDQDSSQKKRRATSKPIEIRRKVPIGFNPNGKTDQIIIAK